MMIEPHRRKISNSYMLLRMKKFADNMINQGFYSKCSFPFIYTDIAIAFHLCSIVINSLSQLISAMTGIQHNHLFSKRL